MQGKGTVLLGNNKNTSLSGITLYNRLRIFNALLHH